MAEAALSGTIRQNIQAKPWLRQILMMVGIAASVAVGVAAVMWSQEPEYRSLYGSMEPQQAASVADALSSAGIPYRIQDTTGAIMVPADQIHNARMQMASAGVITDGTGMEMLREEQGFGVSDFMQAKKYDHALETELARTIESMRSVRKARIHLAIPKQSVFVRDQQHAGASVMLDVYAGRTLDQKQVQAIVNMVSSSVPMLSPDDVTVVDQNGDLLTAMESNDELEVSSKQFEYRKKVESEYERRITNLLTPIAGIGKVKVQAAVELDFAHVEESRESWNPDRQVVRSEQINTDRTKGDTANPAGVPGALSNQPPGRADENAGANAAVTSEETSSITRNYEIERILNYTARPAGDIQRLSIAVVLDNAGPDTSTGRRRNQEPTITYSDEQIQQLTALVKDAVGFDEARGDRVSVIAANFQPPVADTTEEGGPAFWQQEWFINLMKQLLTGIAVILIVFSVIRPGVKSLMQAQLPGASGTTSGEAGALTAGRELNPAIAALGGPETAQRMENTLDAIREVADQDPRLVAQVVKNWIENDGK